MFMFVCFVRISIYFILISITFSVSTLSVFKVNAQVVYDFDINIINSDHDILKSHCDLSNQSFCFDQEFFNQNKFEQFPQYSYIEQYDNSKSHFNPTTHQFSSGVNALTITAIPLALRFIPFNLLSRQFFSPLTVAVTVASAFLAGSLINQIKKIYDADNSLGLGSLSLINPQSSHDFGVKNHNHYKNNVSNDNPNPNSDDHKKMLIASNKTDDHQLTDIEKQNLIIVFEQKLEQLKTQYYSLDHQTFSQIIKQYIDLSMHDTIDQDFTLKKTLLEDIYQYFSYSIFQKAGKESINDLGSEAQYVFLLHIIKIVDNYHIDKTIADMNLRYSSHAYHLLKKLTIFLDNYHDKEKLENLFVKKPLSEYQLEQEVKLLEKSYLQMSIDQLTKILGQFLSPETISSVTPKKLVTDLIDHFSQYFFHPKYIKQLKYKYIFYVQIIGLKDEAGNITSKKLNIRDVKYFYRTKVKFIDYLKNYPNSHQYSSQLNDRNSVDTSIDQQLNTLMKKFFQLSESEWKQRLKDYVKPGVLNSVTREQLISDLEKKLNSSSDKQQSSKSNIAFIKRAKIIFLSLIIKLNEISYSKLSEFLGLKGRASSYKVKERIEHFLLYYPVNDFQDLKAAASFHQKPFSYSMLLTEIDRLQQDFYAMDNHQLFLSLNHLISAKVIRALDRRKFVDDLYKNFEKVYARAIGYSAVTNGMKLLYIFLAMYGRIDRYKRPAIVQNLGFKDLTSISTAMRQLSDYLTSYTLAKHINLASNYSKENRISQIPDLSIDQLNTLLLRITSTIGKSSNEELNKRLKILGLSLENTTVDNIDDILDSLQRYLFNLRIEKMPESSELRTMHGKILLAIIISEETFSLVGNILTNNNINSKSDIYSISQQVDFFISNVYPLEINHDQSSIDLDKIKHSILVDNDSINLELIYEITRRLSIDRYYVPIVVEKLQKLCDYYHSINQSHKIDYVFSYIFESSQDAFDLYRLDDQSLQSSDQLLAIIDLYSVLDSVPRVFLNWMELRDYQKFTLKRHLIQSRLIDPNNTSNFAFDLSTRVSEFIKSHPEFSNYSLKQHHKIEALFLARLGIPNIYQSNLYRLLHLPIEVIKQVEKQLYPLWISDNLHHNIQTRSSEELVELFNNLTRSQIKQFNEFFPDVGIKNLTVDQKLKLSLSFIDRLQSMNDLDNFKVFLSQVLKLDYPLMIPSGIYQHGLISITNNSDNDSGAYLQVLNKFKQFVESKKSCQIGLDQCNRSALLEIGIDKDHQSTVDQSLQQFSWIDQLKQAYDNRSEYYWEPLAEKLGYVEFNDYFQSKLNSFNSYLYDKDPLLWSLFVVEVLKIKGIVDIKQIKSKFQHLDSSKGIEPRNIKTILLSITKEFIDYMDISKDEFANEIDLYNNIVISMYSLNESQLDYLVQSVGNQGTQSEIIDHIVDCASRIFYNRRLLYIFNHNILESISDQNNLGVSLFKFNTYIPQKNLIDTLENAFFNCLNRTNNKIIKDSKLHRLSHSYHASHQVQKRYFLEDLSVFWQHLSINQLKKLLVNVRLRIKGENGSQDKFINPIVPYKAAKITKVDIAKFLNSLSDDEKIIFLVLIVNLVDVSIIDLAQLFNSDPLDLSWKRDKIKARFLSVLSL